MKSNWKDIKPRELISRLKEGKAPVILDVRESYEWQEGHIPGARHIPLGELPDRLNELNAGQETVVVCWSGGRSSRACDFLASAGYRVTNLKGGMSSWNGEVV